MEVRLNPPFTGWAWLALDPPRVLRPAEVWEVEEQARQRPIATLTLWVQPGQDDLWLASGPRLKPVGVHLVWGAQTFDTVRAVEAGGRWWYLGPGAQGWERAAVLREALDQGLLPSELDLPGLRPAERRLYAQVQRARTLTRRGDWRPWAREAEGWARGADPFPLIPPRPHPSRRLRARKAADRGRWGEPFAGPERLRRALELAGARLLEARPHPSGWQVAWSLGGVLYRSLVARDLTVLEAGLCLSGRDAEQDLTSLASLLTGVGPEAEVM
jgi:hypothetical protein